MSTSRRSGDCVAARARCRSSLVELLFGRALVSAYQRRSYWNNYWTSHERYATRMTIDRPAARIGRAATRDAAIDEGRTSRANSSLVVLRTA